MKYEEYQTAVEDFFNHTYPDHKEDLTDWEIELLYENFLEKFSLVDLVDFLVNK